MPRNRDDDIRSLWRDQLAASVQITPEQLRKRAGQFELQTRRRYLRDQASFGVLAVICAYAVIAVDGALGRLGSAMLLIWAVYGMYGLRRFGSPLALPPDAGTESCAAVHRRQLERQRDIVLSWPLGMGLALPGLMLAILGSPLGPRHLPWAPAIALAGVSAFVYLAMLIYGKTLAARWQREIDGLEALRREADR
jgi:hypothetical protein